MSLGLTSSYLFADTVQKPINHRLSQSSTAILKQIEEQLLAGAKIKEKSLDYVRAFPNESLVGKIAIHKNYPVSRKDLSVALGNITSPFACGIRLNPNSSPNFKQTLDMELHFFNQAKSYVKSEVPDVTWYSIINEHGLWNNYLLIGQTPGIGSVPGSPSGVGSESGGASGVGSGCLIGAGVWGSDGSTSGLVSGFVSGSVSGTGGAVVVPLKTNPKFILLTIMA